MRRVRVVQVVGYVLLATLASAIGIYSAATGVPDLQAPVQVDEAVFFADGGSFHVVVRDASGRRFAFGASGSLDTPRSEFPLYTQRWWPYLPVPTLVLRESKSEQELLGALQKWVAQGGQDEYGRMALTQVEELLTVRTSSRSKQ